MEVDLNFNDTISEWWTGTEAVDSDADVEERLTDLFAFLQFNGGEAAVLVGHSLLFREIMKRFTAEECREARARAPPAPPPPLVSVPAPACVSPAVFPRPARGWGRGSGLQRAGNGPERPSVPPPLRSASRSCPRSSPRGSCRTPGAWGSTWSSTRSAGSRSWTWS